MQRNSFPLVSTTAASSVLLSAVFIPVCPLWAPSSEELYATRARQPHKSDDHHRAAVGAAVDSGDTSRRSPIMGMADRHLTNGAIGEDVAALQRNLARLGFDVSANERRDQLFGATTTRAVTEFQRSYGLRATRTIDPATVAALTRAVREMPQDTVMMPSAVERERPMVPEQHVAPPSMSPSTPESAVPPTPPPVSVSSELPKRRVSGKVFDQSHKPIPGLDI